MSMRVRCNGAACCERGGEHQGPRRSHRRARTLALTRARTISQRHRGPDQRQVDEPLGESCRGTRRPGRIQLLGIETDVVRQRQAGPSIRRTASPGGPPKASASTSQNEQQREHALGAGQGRLRRCIGRSRDPWPSCSSDSFSGPGSAAIRVGLIVAHDRHQQQDWRRWARLSPRSGRSFCLSLRPTVVSR